MEKQSLSTIAQFKRSSFGIARSLIRSLIKTTLPFSIDRLMANPVIADQAAEKWLDLR